MTTEETKDDIAQIKLEIAAYNTAILESIPTGSVTEFRQGTTHIVKASTKELRSVKNSLKNDLHVLESSL